MTTHSELRIGELAAEFGLNPKTIRYYQSIGLLSDSWRSRAGYRLFGDSDCERLRFIVRARAIGLTLQEIHEILVLRTGGEQPCAHVLELLEKKLLAVDAELQALADFRQELVTLQAEAARTTIADSCICGIIEQHQPSHDGDISHGLPAPMIARPSRR